MRRPGSLHAQIEGASAFLQTAALGRAGAALQPPPACAKSKKPRSSTSSSATGLSGPVASHYLPVDEDLRLDSEQSDHPDLDQVTRRVALHQAS